MTDSRPHSQSRALAAKILADVLHGQSLTEGLQRGNHLPQARDRALVAELTYGVCRWFYRLDAVVQQLLRKPMKKSDADIRALLLMGVYQLLFTRIPPHAAVAETAGAARLLRKKWAVAVINGVLRRFQREHESLLAQALKKPGARFSQPAWFVAAIRKAWPEQWESILQALLERPPLTVRVNTQRIPMSEYLEQLAAAGLTVQPVAGVPAALNFDRPVSVDEIPGFAAGLVSVQDAGAQIAAPMLQPESGSHILDACAAPGGKTGHILEQAPDLNVTAVDVDADRLSRVKENMQRLGYKATLVQGDAASPAGDWAEASYDRILVDAPCTATGVIRRHPDIKLLRRESDVAGLAQRQRDILNALWPLLKRGGKLLYATCSLLPEENELQVKKFIAGNRDCVAAGTGDFPGLKREFGIQILPGMQQMDGFYYALMEKS